MKKTHAHLVAVLAACLAVASCSPTPDSPEAMAELHAEVLGMIDEFKQDDPGIAKFFSSSYGYAVFPDIGKGGIGIAGAYGNGEVFEQGEVVGFCDVSQASIGIQLGGQSYSEVVFFQDKRSLDSFKNGTFELAAQVSAVVVKAGASEAADYSDGVVIFTKVQGGLMYEVSIGGQEFDYEAK